MSSTISSADGPRGCPSGQSPAFDRQQTADPSLFVTQKGETQILELAVFGAKCAGCIAKIEGAVKALPGITETRLNLSTGKLHVAWTGDATAPQMITEAVADLGYRVVPFDPHENERVRDDEGRFLMRCLAVAGFATANVMLISVGVWASTGGEMGQATRSLMHFISGMIAIPAALFAGRPFFRSAFAALKNRHANMDVPISLAILLALGFSLFETLNHGQHAYFDAAVMLIFFLLIGRYLDHLLRDRARTAARDLLALQAVSANRLDAEGQVTAIAARDIAIGDRLVIAAGERIPVDGRIEEGASDFDLALVTGESTPVLRRTGEEIRAGTVNLTRSVTMRATATLDTSLVADLARLIEAGQQSKSHFTRLADRAARAYVPIVHTLAALTFLAWLFLPDGGARVGLMNAIAVLIITCPCAMGLATPAVQTVATGRLFKAGILVKTGDALERLAHITHMVFDKTGTLTLGRLRLVNEAAVPGPALEAAAALARTSHHPISRAISRAVGAGPIANDVEELPGAGLRGRIDGEDVWLGNANFVGLPASACPDGPHTFLKRGSDAPVLLHLEDQLRPDSRAVIAGLKEEGLDLRILSGDQPETVAALASQIGIETWRAAMSPDEKLAHLDKLRRQGAKIAMVGDGLNDAPSLATADVSLSPGTAADATQSAADLVFQGDSLDAVRQAHHVARRAEATIRQNFIFAAFYNLVAAPLAMAGVVTPLIAALAMSGSSLVVILNAMRLTRD